MERLNFQNLHENLLKNDFVFVFTINKALSSQYDSIKNLEKEEVSQYLVQSRYRQVTLLVP